MTVIYDLIIVGAGASGLYAGVHAQHLGLNTLLLEKMEEPGKKLLLAGSGQCNLTNDRPIREFLTCYGDHSRFLKPALLSHTNSETMAFFESLGLKLVTMPATGKVFPTSRKARDLRDALVQYLPADSLHCREKVIRLATHQEGMEVITDQGHYLARSVLLATGGQSFPQTGSTGDGYGLAQRLGHHLVQPRPGLSPIVIRPFLFSQLAGTSFEAISVSLYHEGRKIKTLTGPMLFTHTGLSGPVILHLSRWASPGDEVVLHFLAPHHRQALRDHWLHDLEHAPQKKIRALMKAVPVSKALRESLMDHLLSRPLSSLAELGRKGVNILVDHLGGFRLSIAEIGGFNIAMVTAGGVTLDEVDSKTMCSKICPALFFSGEVLDIDGDTGGYDLQACWSTAYLAIQSIVQTIDPK